MVVELINLLIYTYYYFTTSYYPLFNNNNSLFLRKSAAALIWLWVQSIFNNTPQGKSILTVITSLGGEKLIQLY